jgi:hypothetical protein
MIWKIWKKIVKRYEKYGRKLWNDMENTEENSKNNWKLRKKILKRYEKYGRNQSWIMKWYGKYRIKLWNDMENMEENSKKKKENIEEN